MAKSFLCTCVHTMIIIVCMGLKRMQACDFLDREDFVILRVRAYDFVQRGWADTMRARLCVRI